MLTYSNSFYCASSQGGKEFIITFKQSHPSLKSDGTAEIVTDDVADIIINSDTANALVKMLSQAIEGENSIGKD